MNIRSRSQSLRLSSHPESRLMKTIQDIVKATVVVCGCCLLIQSVANAQTSRRKDDEIDIKELEERLSKAEENLVSEYKSAAVEVYNSGDKERSLQMLKRLRSLNPKIAGLDDRMKSIQEELLQENLDDFEVDMRKNQWEGVGHVLEGKTFRLQSAGDIRVSFSGTVGIDGLEPDEDAKDYLPGVPLGALIGVIVADGKPGKPFPVQSKLEMTPKKSGRLFVKINVPDGTRCTGKVKIRVSGYIDSGQTKK